MQKQSLKELCEEIVKITLVAFITGAINLYFERVK